MVEICLADPVQPIRILVVDDNKPLARSWKRMLDRRGHRTDVACSLKQARARLSVTPPPRYDVVLLDLVLGDGDGAALLPLLEQLDPPPAVGVVSSHYDSARAVELCGRCAAGIPKPVTGDTLHAFVEAVAGRNDADTLERFCRQHGFSAQETQVLRAAADGHSNAEVATELDCGPGTVASYWRRIFRKTGQRTKRNVVADVLRFALERLGR